MILKTAAAALVLLAGLITGCVSPELRRQALLNEARSARFVDLMERGKTTRVEEQDFIRESRSAWKAFRQSLRLEDVK